MTDLIRRKLAQRLAASRGLNSSSIDEKKAGSSERTIPRALQNSSLPLSHAQERMWFLHKLDPSASAYNVCVLWHFHGQLDAGLLQKSAARLTERHSIFRTLYNVDAEGRARQEVLSSLAPEWHNKDLRLLNADEREQHLGTIAQQAGTAPFDLSCGSPLRLVLVAMSDQHHVLVMVGQHIVWDGPSFGVFSQELANGYNLLIKGEPDQYLQPPVQYIDFADWHRSQWEDNLAKRAAELAFWETQLFPLPEPLDFPVDFDRGVSQDEAGDWCTESVGTDTTAALLALASREQLTSFEILIATIALLMTRLSRSAEVTIGTIASHRNLPELNEVIGNFGNVVPLRLPVSNSWSFRQLLQECATRCRSAFAHAEMPFEYLLDHLKITRGATRNPLLDTMVTFLSHGMEAPEMEGLEVHWQKHFNGTSQIDLSFDALLQDGELQLQATWRRSLYRPNTVPKHLRRLARLLKECIASPDTPLAERSLLLPEEYPQLTDAWGKRPAEATEADTLVGWFENTVSKLPDAIALYRTQKETGSDNDLRPQSVSFAELNARANRLARWLVSRGIGPEDRVAIALPRRPEWFVAMLATLKTGAAFVPIDPNYPADYINRVITLAQPSLVFMDKATDLNLSPSPTVKDLAQISVNLSVAEQSARQAGFAAHNLANADRIRPLSPAHPVCIVFTSGSSGQPKGVVVPHSALVNLLSSHREDLYKEASRLTGRSLFHIGHAWSLAFDAAWQPTLWMFDGHALHLFDVDIMQDPIALAREIIVRKLDFIELTPGLLDEVLPWLQSGLTEAGGQHLPGHVPAILAFGGEAVKHALWERIVKLEGTSGFNLYGPTEACVDTMIARASANESPNIGKPVAGAQVYVLDACLQLAPPGVAGELAIAGAGLARGYLTRGDLTAGQFIANPHGEPGSRLYRTGDRVKWLPGGILDYIGRIDDQIKIRGFRVEPLEVEATVEKIIQRPCAVVARKSGSGTLQLLCFVELSPTNEAADDDANTSSDPDDLLQLCTASLPSHLVPKHIIPVLRLPRLPNGKIDRRSLVMPAGLDNAPGREPRNPLEHLLCQLMAEVLGSKKVTIDDGFFELGGDSISVIKLVSLARRDGITLTARQVFDSRCVARLASLLEANANGSNPLSGAYAIKHDDQDIGRALPTLLMKRYLSLNQPLQRFAQIASLPLPPDITEPELNGLLDALLERHALLSARLVTPEDSLHYLDVPAGKNAAKVNLGSIQLLDNAGNQASLIGTAANTKQLTPAALARQLCEQLNPAQGVMLAAARVYDANHDQQTLWLAISHLVVDLSSWHIIAGDLALGRTMQKRGEPIALPAVPTAWRSWSAAQPQSDNIAKPAKPRGTLASARRMSWTLTHTHGQCPATALSRRLGLPLSSLLPALTVLATLRAGLVPQEHNQTIYLAVERHGRDTNAPAQDLSRTLGWFAKEVTIALQSLKNQAGNLAADGQLLIQLRQWCAAIAQLDDPLASAAEGRNALSAERDWQLGFNFLGDFAASNNDQIWAPQPRMDLLVDACGDHWPLLHDLDVNAYYIHQNGARLLQFDALGPAESIDTLALERVFAELELLFKSLAGVDAARSRSDGLTQHIAGQKEVTPLQYEMLRQCRGDTDPWTTQMELHLVSRPELAISAASLQQSAAQLLSRHEALRAGFLIDAATTFIPDQVELNWQNLDWRGESAERQTFLLSQLREHWHQDRFRLDQPPLLRFTALQLGDDQWRLLVNCHHLLLDGWSVPRILHELLGGACGQAIENQPALSWSRYLEWLETQDRSTALRYWNRNFQGLDAPSLLRPERTKRTPSEDLRDSLTRTQSSTLANIVKLQGVSQAALYQLAWAQTLSHELGQSDVVFGLFDSGRAAAIDGLSALVGLVTQLVPLRVNTASSLPLAAHLRELQAQQFEWQSLVPVRLDNLDATLRFGELFDSLLVIENALDADSSIPSLATSLPMLQEQIWHDSIGHAVGLFIYPGASIELRLCYDPQSITTYVAQHLVALFKQNLQRLIDGLETEAGKKTHPHSAYAEREFAPELIPNASGD